MKRPLVIDYNKGALPDFAKEIGFLNQKLVLLRNKYTFTNLKTGKDYVKYPDHVFKSLKHIWIDIGKLDSQVDRIIRRDYGKRND